MARSIAEESKPISIFWLRKHMPSMFIQSGKINASGTISWTNGFGRRESSIGYSAVINALSGEQSHMRLCYTHTNGWTDEKESMDYTIPLTTTPCNLGGIRYWFICPLTRNGQYCGRRVGVLYSIGKYFGCRHCGNIAYSNQMAGGRYRLGSTCMPDIEKLEAEIKRRFYNGKPTRKYKRLIRMTNRLEKDCFHMNCKINDFRTR